jgi:hypothetical protein
MLIDLLFVGAVFGHFLGWWFLIPGGVVMCFKVYYQHLFTLETVRRLVAVIPLPLVLWAAVKNPRITLGKLADRWSTPVPTAATTVTAGTSVSSTDSNPFEAPVPTFLKPAAVGTPRFPEYDGGGEWLSSA